MHHHGLTWRSSILRHHKHAQVLLAKRGNDLRLILSYYSVALVIITMQPIHANTTSQAKPSSIQKRVSLHLWTVEWRLLFLCGLGVYHAPIDLNTMASSLQSALTNLQQNDSWSRMIILTLRRLISQLTFLSRHPYCHWIWLQWVTGFIPVRCTNFCIDIASPYIFGRGRTPQTSHFHRWWSI